MVKVETAIKPQLKLNANILPALELSWLTPIVSFFRSYRFLRFFHSVLNCFCLRGACPVSCFMKNLTIFLVSANLIQKSEFYRGLDCIPKLMETLLSWLSWGYGQKQTFRWLQLSQAERQKFLSPLTVICCICGQYLTRSVLSITVILLVRFMVWPTLPAA